MKIKKNHILLILVAIAASAIPLRRKIFRLVTPVIQIVKGKHTVADRVEEFGQTVRDRLMPDFERIGVDYPVLVKN